MTETANVYRYHRGESPLVISVPHAGVKIPAEMENQIADSAKGLTDTDWFVDRLYAFALDMGATVIAANYSRYVVDLNRPADGASLYPGQFETGLLPHTTFMGEPLYKDGQTPDDAEIKRRKTQYWQPYHDRIEAELKRAKAFHGYAVLWDAHSILSRVPDLFDGKLPDLNIGTNIGASCGEGLGEAVLTEAKKAKAYSSVLNGRFKGGYITRNYGQPDANIHAVQLEIAQTAYMDETSASYDRDKANRLRPVIQNMMEAALGHAKGGNDG